MPIGIGVEGGSTYRVARERISSLTEDQALESLQNIKTHLSQPGRDRGVLTLHNRSKDGSEMTLERKSGLQLLFQEHRLDDTCIALRNMLRNAGQHEALKELDDYLSRHGGNKNRIESSKMVEILNRHLPPLEEGSSKEEPLEESSLNEEPPEEVSPKEDLRPSPPPKEVSLKEGLRLLPSPEKVSSREDLYTPFKIEKGRVLGTGAFGSTYLVKIDGKDGVLKEFKKPQPLSLTRSGEPNEAMGSYLTSKKQPTYHLDKVNIAQPTFYMISIEKEGKREHQMVTPHEMRQLVKEAMKTGSEVLCHGIVMPKAKGKEVSDLIKEGTLTDVEKKQLVRSTLESIKGLNERGFVHRDIKPENTVFDGESGTTTLIDTGTLFKSSKDQEKHPDSETVSKPVGTWLYMPSRVLEEQPHGTETDLHALGVMTLGIDHPLALEEISDWIEDRGNTTGISSRGLRYHLSTKIGDLNNGIERTRSPAMKEKLIALRDDLEKLRKDIGDPNSLSGFAMKCIEMAEEPAEKWKDRDWAQQQYSELLKHPGLQEEKLGD